jgi:protein-S-isoprenylcysteine O-methyltransferase Ste14
MAKKQSNGILTAIPFVAMVAVLVLFVFSLSQHHSVFPDSWFPSQLTAFAFTILFCIWILGELANFGWSRKNSGTTANKDKGSFRVVVTAYWAAIFAIFISRNLEIGVFGGNLQYVGLTLFAAGIALRERSVWVLGKYFTVQVQIRENAKLVTWGPYSHIRHPSYTGSLFAVIGISLAVGTWLGAVFGFGLAWIAHGYRIRVEEEALQAAFGSEWDEYKKRTWKLIPGF